MVGYQSYYIFAGSTAAIHLGLRVDPRIRGKRLGMNFSERGDEDMLRLNPKVMVQRRAKKRSPGSQDFSGKLRQKL